MNNYGFKKEKLNDGFDVETLITGDGKTVFSPVDYGDSKSSIIVSYGTVEDELGERYENNDAELDKSFEPKWQIKFDNPISAKALINATGQAMIMLLSDDDKDNFLALYPVLSYFEYKHLPSNLQNISQPFHDLAWSIPNRNMSAPETAACLRRLLEAKDCAVRATL